MERSSQIDFCIHLADRVRQIGRTLAHQGWEIVTLLVGRVLDAFEWLFERGKSSYEKLEPRLMAQGNLLNAWWERRGWPLGALGLLGNALIFLPVDLCWYLLACLEHLVGLKPTYLLAWLVFAGSVRAGRFYFKEILPDQRALRSVGKPANGIQREEGS